MMKGSRYLLYGISCILLSGQTYLCTCLYGPASSEPGYYKQLPYDNLQLKLIYALFCDKLFIDIYMAIDIDSHRKGGWNGES